MVNISHKIEHFYSNIHREYYIQYIDNTSIINKSSLVLHLIFEPNAAAQLSNKHSWGYLNNVIIHSCHPYDVYYYPNCNKNKNIS